MCAARGALISARLSSISVVVMQHFEGAQNNSDVSPQRPVGDIFEIGLQAICEILFLLGRAAMAANLRQARQPRLKTVAALILLVDLPEQLVVGL